MPTYTFDCRACGRTFDALTSLGGGATCCGEAAARRSVYAFAMGKREQKVNVTRFIEAHEEIRHQGAPELWSVAKRKAKALMAAGEPLRSKVVPEVNV